MPIDCFLSGSLDDEGDAKSELLPCFLMRAPKPFPNACFFAMKLNYRMVCGYFAKMFYIFRIV